MIQFLIKLATLLDKRGQYNLAEEVDALVVKLAADGPVETQEGLVSASYEKLMDALSQAYAQFQGLEGDPRSGRLATKPRESIDILMKNVNPNASTNEKQRWAEHVATWIGGWALSMRNESFFDKPGFKVAWKNLLDAARPFYKPAASKTDADRASKVNPKHVANPIISQIQRLLEIKEDGMWGKDTNAAFLKAMRATYPDMVRNGKFDGSLKDALDLLSKSVLHGIDSRPDADKLDWKHELTNAPKEPNKAANSVVQKTDNEVPPKAVSGLGGPGRR